MRYSGREMDQGIEPQRPTLQMGKEEYLKRLPEIDRSNVLRISELFSIIIQATNREGILLAAGGSVTKSGSRKDIDLGMVFQRKEEDPKRDDYPDYFQYALADFRSFKQFTETMIGKDSQFQISEIIEPTLDLEYNNPAILRNDGTITITSKEGGTPLEFLRRFPQPSLLDFKSKQTEPFVILVEEKFVSLPNLRNPKEFEEWLEINITTPMEGMEDLTHPDGSHFSHSEQLAASREQIKSVVDFRLQRKVPLDEILKMLMNIAGNRE